jgi:hypothetical protein
MTAVQATFHGSQVILPPGVGGHPSGQVTVIFPDSGQDPEGMPAAMQQAAFAKVWENPEDEIYDRL